MGRRSMREEILEAAQERFHSRGFNAAGVKDITDGAGVPKGSFYNHFESKEALAIVALQRYGASRRLEDLGDHDVAPLTRLRRHFEFLRDEVVAYELTRGCLLGNLGAEVADHSDTVREAVRQGFGDWGDALAATLAEAQAAGTVRADLDPRKTAQYLLSAWEGTLLTTRASRSTEALESFFDITFNTLLV